MYEGLVKTLRESRPNRRFMFTAADAIEDLSASVEALKSTTNMVFEETKGRTVIKFESRWIPVAERLPEFEGAVLCMRKSIVYGVRPYQEILYVDEFGFKNFDDIYLADGVVTHWMPLPEPPKDGDSDV